MNWPEYYTMRPALPVRAKRARAFAPRPLQPIRGMAYFGCGDEPAARVSAGCMSRLKAISVMNASLPRPSIDLQRIFSSARVATRRPLIG